MTIESFTPWSENKEILVILAHPDDPEFFLGGTISRWISEGHSIRYCLLTKGDKGSDNISLTNDDVANIRVIEQNAAAELLGVKSVEFLNHPDGYLIPDLEIRKEVVGIIRKHHPNILVTCDPTNYFENRRYINHPDHRAAGQVVIDAVFPAAGNQFFFPELLQAGMSPHTVEEVWMSLSAQPNIYLDVTGQWETRLNSLKMHKSQIGDPIVFEKRMKEWLELDDKGHYRYEERFRRIVFKR
jgi:LmbE family N-acetylglucosaminyl deacetylase